jgi:hypothetical protein
LAVLKAGTFILVLMPNTLAASTVVSGAAEVSKVSVWVLMGLIRKAAATEAGARDTPVSGEEPGGA